MVGFDVALSVVFTTLLFILPGYLVGRAKLVRPEHLSALGALLIYVCAPCMIFGTLNSLELSRDNLIGMAEFTVATLAFQAIGMGLIWFFVRRRYEDARFRLLIVAAILGNVGFFGLPVIRALMPANPEVACYSAVYMNTMNIFVFTVAVYCLTGDRRYMTLKAALINPTTAALVLGLVFYLGQPYFRLPALLTSAVGSLGSMTTPLCMIILGVRLSAVELGPLFRRPFVYLVCALKLLVFPILSFALISLFPVAESLKASILILCGTPCASITLSLAEMHNAQQELAANCVLVSTLLCAVTIPLLTLLV